MSQPRPTLSSPSRECPVVDGVRQIQRIAVRNAEVGGIPINRALPTRERRTVGAGVFSITPGRRYSTALHPAWMWGRIRTPGCKRSPG